MILSTLLFYFQENLSKLNQDIDSVLGNDGDFIDDDMWPGQKAPPPYPGKFSLLLITTLGNITRIGFSS